MFSTPILKYNSSIVLNGGMTVPYEWINHKTYIHV